MAVLGQGTKGQPGAAASDKFAPRRLGAYLAVAVLLTALGRTVVVWLYYDFDYVSSGADDFLKALYDPRIMLEPELFSPYVWAFTAALLVTGVVAAMNRRAGRGAALLCGFVMFATAARELVGLATSDQFRQWYIGGNDLEVAIISSWSVVLLFSAATVVLMLRAGERPAAHPAGTPAGGTQTYLVAGGLMVVLGLALVGWIVRMLTRDEGGIGAGQYFKGLVDPGESFYPVLAGTTEFWEAVFAVSLLALGVLALMRRPVVRGAAITVLAVYLYINVRRMIGMTITDYPNEAPSERQVPVLGWDAYTEDLEGWLVLATYVGGSLMAVAVIAMMLRAPETGAEAYAPPAAGGHIPPQPVGQPDGQAADRTPSQPQRPSRPGTAPQPGYDAPPQAPTMAAPPPPAAPPSAGPPPPGSPPAG